MTPTGREVGEALYVKRWPQRVTQAYLPYDYGWAMTRFLRHWRPRLGLIMEAELWPALCDRASRLQVPLVLVNARLSERSLRKGLRWQALVTPALRSLAAVLAQTDADAARLRRLGREAVAILGNLKFDTTAAPDAVAAGVQWRGACGARAVVLVASTREGEEALLLRAWRDRSPSPRTSAQPRPLLLIVPRHPQRFDAVAEEITAAGFSLARRSRDFPGACADADVVLGDSMGEMAAYYAMADVAIIGGSLLPFGAQNLIEACAQGVPVLVGPHSYNFEQAAIEAIAAGAALRVLDAPVAIDQALSLVGDPAARSAMADAGRAFSVAHRGATQRTMDALRPWLG
jgi:3-deoxy-D-manno-octulosonic-acid transferase